MFPLASAEQLSARLGVSLSGVDLERALAAIDDASALVRGEAGEDWVDDHDEPEEVPELIQAIVLQVAYRAYRNPEGVFSTQVGDVQVSYGREGHGGAIFLTDDEKKALRRAMGRSAVSSIQLETPYAIGIDNYYVPVEGGGDPLPMAPFPWDVL